MRVLSHTGKHMARRVKAADGHGARKLIVQAAAAFLLVNASVSLAEGLTRPIYVLFFGRPATWEQAFPIVIERFFHAILLTALAVSMFMKADRYAATMADLAKPYYEDESEQPDSSEP